MCGWMSVFVYIKQYEKDTIKDSHIKKRRYFNYKVNDELKIERDNCCFALY